MNKITIDLTEREMKNLLIIKNDNLTAEEFVSNIVKEKLNSVLLEYGFSYNSNTEELFNGNNQKVVFTKKEKALFHYLVLFSLKENTKYADINSIKKEVWKSEDTSIFSIRNFIKSIREKTFDEIIKNKNNHGYRVNIL